MDRPRVGRAFDHGFRSRGGAGTVSDFDPLGGLDLIVRDFARALGAQVAHIGVADSSRANVEVLATWGGKPSRRDPPSPLRAAVGFVGRALALDHAAIDPVDPGDPSFGAVAHEGHITHGIGVSVRPPDGPEGALWAGFSSVPPLESTLSLWLADSYARLTSLCLHDGAALAGLLGGSAVDGLTGASTYAAFRHELSREIQRSDRNGLPLSCCFIDLDRFKRVNDRYGHLHGSRVLAKVGAVLRGEVRTEDTVGRYGGDEFVLLLPGTDEPAAGDLAHRLRSLITTTMINLPHDPIDVSIGVAQRRAGQTADELLTTADNALLQAKAAGGGIVIRANESGASPKGKSRAQPIQSDHLSPAQPTPRHLAACTDAESSDPPGEIAPITGLTELELALLHAIAARPRTPLELKLTGVSGTTARALVWLEHLGLARMAGSSDTGAWMITDRGRTQL